MSDPKYVYRDEDGATLAVSPYPHAHAGDIAAVSTGGIVYVLPEHFREVAAGLWTGAGLPAPVILEHLDREACDQVRADSIRTYLAEGRLVGIDGPGDDITPAAARFLAARIASLADLAESEPDPAEVEELTRVLRGCVPGMALPGGDYKTAVARGFAEAALRWFRDKQQRGGAQP